MKTTVPLYKPLMVMSLAVGLAIAGVACGDRSETMPASPRAQADEVRPETLRVQSRAYNDTAREETSDSAVTERVKSLLMADGIGQGLDISVETNDGVVTLQGELDSRADADHVADIARDVEGVRRVDTDRLVVTAAASTD